jgi:hypothetical protein
MNCSALLITSGSEWDQSGIRALSRRNLTCLITEQFRMIMSILELITHGDGFLQGEFTLSLRQYNQLASATILGLKESFCIILPFPDFADNEAPAKMTMQAV